MIKKHCSLIFYITGEFFVDIDLPVTLKYRGSAGCVHPTMNENSIQQKLEGVMNTLKQCRNKCIVHDVMIDCTKHDGVITVKFDVTIFNPHPNEIPLNCSTTCKRASMVYLLKDSYEILKEVQAIVKSKKEILELPGEGAPSVDVSRTLDGPRSMPQFLCDPGQVLTRNRLCGKCT